MYCNDSNYSKNKTSKSSIQEFANAELFTLQQLLENKESQSDKDYQKVIQTPKSPAFAAESLGELMSSTDQGATLR